MRIEQGDCLELLKTVPDKSVQLILCDLPYGITDFEWDTPLPLDALWKEFNRIMKDNGCVCMFGIAKFSVLQAMSNLKNYRYKYTWVKNASVGFLNANKMPLRRTEDILVFYKHLPIYNQQRKTGFKNYYKLHAGNRTNLYHGHDKSTSEVTDGTRAPDDVLEFPIVQGIKHGTVKPDKLLQHLIKTYTNEGDVVLDPTMGSGSTGVSCVATNREFIGFELNEEFFNLAKSRIEEAKCLASTTLEGHNLKHQS